MRDFTCLRQEEVVNAVKGWNQEATNDEENQSQINRSILDSFPDKFEVV